MPFSGGVYSFPSLPGSFNPAIVGQNATADDWNTLAADLATNGLSMCITRNGQSTITANIPMSSHKLTGLSAGSAVGDSVRYDQTAIYGYLGGLGTARASNTTISIATGACADDTNASVIRLSAVTLNCGTTGANGLDTGALANDTWYHMFAIGKTDGTAASLASTNASSPTMPGGYTLKRRIGSFKTDGSAHVLPYLQAGDKFQWTTIIAETPGSGAGPTLQALVGVPTGVVITAILNISVTANGGGQCGMEVTTPNVDTAVAQVVAPTSLAAACVAFVDTDTSAQVNFTYTGAANVSTSSAASVGWIDTRGRDA